MLLENAAFRRLILPALLRELFLTGSVLKPVVLAHCEGTFCRSWSATRRGIRPGRLPSAAVHAPTPTHPPTYTCHTKDINTPEILIFWEKIPQAFFKANHLGIYDVIRCESVSG